MATRAKVMCPFFVVSTNMNKARTVHETCRLRGKIDRRLTDKVEVTAPIAVYCVILLTLFSSAVSVLAQEEPVTGPAFNQSRQSDDSAFRLKAPPEVPDEAAQQSKTPLANSEVQLDGAATGGAPGAAAPGNSLETTASPLQMPSTAPVNANILPAATSSPSATTSSPLLSPHSEHNEVPSSSANLAKLISAGGHAVPHEIVLPNGLRVVLLEEHSFPVVSCLAWYRVGSRNETPGVTGLSHLVEHLLFQNIGNFKKNEFGATIVANGGQFNGFTSEDFTAFYSTVAPSKLDLVLHGEAERMRGAKFARGDVQVEINNLLREFDQESREPIGALNREVHAVAFQQHPYRNPPGGWRNDTEHLTYEDARAFYERFYYPDNAALILVGDFKREIALPLVKKYFLGLPKAPAPIPPMRVVERMPPFEKRVTMRFPVKRESLVVAYSAPQISDPDAPAMAVLEKLLNGSISGRLRKQLVDTRVCGAAQSVFEIKRDPSLFLLNLNASGGTPLQKVLDSCDSLIGQLRSQLVGEPELTRARKQAEFEFFNESDGPYRAGFHLGYFETLMNWQVAYTWPDKIRSVTAVDVQRAARRYLVSDTRVVGQLVSTTPSSPPSSTKTTAPAAMEPSGKTIFKRAAPPEAALLSPSQNSLKSCKKFPNLRLAAYKQLDSTLAPLLAEADKRSDNDHLAPSKRGGGSITPISERGLSDAAQGVTTKSGQAMPSQPSVIRSTATPTQSKVLSGDKSELARSLAAGQLTYQTLPNGLAVIIIESHLNPVVQIMGSIKAGSVYEPSDKRGLSALTAQAMSCGGSRTNRQQLISEQDDIGLPPKAMIKFDSALEEIKFQTRCLSRDLFSQLTRMSGCLREARLQDTDVEKAKSDLLLSMTQGEDVVSAKVERALLRSLIPASSPYYPVDPTERAKSIATLKASDVKDFYNNHVAPNLTAVIIAGDVEPKQVLSYLERLLSGWSTKNNVAKPPILATDRHGSKSSLPLKGNNQSLVCLGRLIGTQTEDREDKTWSDLLIADCALTNHPIFSRINQRLENEPELAANFRAEALKAHVQPLSEAIIWSLYLPLDANSSSSSIASIQNELKHYGKAGLTVQELTEAKRYLLGSIPVSRMSNLETLSNFYLEGLVQRKELEPFARASVAIRLASLDSVNKFIFGGFKPDQAAVVVAGSRQLIKQVHPVHPEPPDVPDAQ
jgi:zinc protease